MNIDLKTSNIKFLDNKYHIITALTVVVLVILISITTTGLSNSKPENVPQNTIIKPNTEAVLGSFTVNKSLNTIPEAEKQNFLKQSAMSMGANSQENVTPEALVKLCLVNGTQKVRSIGTQNARYYKNHTDELDQIAKTMKEYCHKSFNQNGVVPTPHRSMEH